MLLPFSGACSHAPPSACNCAAASSNRPCSIDLRAACRGFEAKVLRTRVQQLLGLPPDDAPRFVVTLRVAADDLFRPCADPDLGKTRCGEEFPKDLDPAHYAWYARQTALAYASPQGFPWTRLGYTYNWRAGADEERAGNDNRDADEVVHGSSP